MRLRIFNLICTTLLFTFLIRGLACEILWIWTKGCMKGNSTDNRNILNNDPGRCFQACGEQTSRIALQDTICNCNFQARQMQPATVCLPCGENTMVVCGNADMNTWSVYEKANQEELKTRNIPINTTGCVAVDRADNSFQVKDCTDTELRSLCNNAYSPPLRPKLSCDNHMGAWSTFPCSSRNSVYTLVNTFKTATYQYYRQSCTLIRNVSYWIGLFAIEISDEFFGTTVFVSTDSSSHSSLNVEISAVSPSSMILSDSSNVELSHIETPIISPTSVIVSNFTTMEIPHTETSVLSYTSYVSSVAFSQIKTTRTLSASVRNEITTNFLSSSETTVITTDTPYSPMSSSLTVSQTINSSYGISSSIMPSETVTSLSSQTTNEVTTQVTNYIETTPKTTLRLKVNSTKSIKRSPKNKTYSMKESTDTTLPVTVPSVHTSKSETATVISTSITTRKYDTTTLLTSTKETFITITTPNTAEDSTATLARSDKVLVIALSVTGVVAICALITLAALATYVRRSIKNLKQPGMRLKTLRDNRANSRPGTTSDQHKYDDDISESDYNHIPYTNYCSAGKRADLQMQENWPSLNAHLQHAEENEYVLYSSSGTRTVRLEQ